MIGREPAGEACGWYFEGGSDVTADRAYFHESGSISITPAFDGELASQPTSGTLTNVVYREVTFSDPTDLYSASFVTGGQCVRVESGTFE